MLINLKCNEFVHRKDLIACYTVYEIYGIDVMEGVMKKMIYLLVLIILLSGCQPTPEKEPEVQVNIEANENNTSEDSQDNEQEDQGPAIQDEKAVLEALNILAEEHVDPSEINAFLKKHISNLGIDSANYALVTYFNQILDYAGRADGEILSPAYQKLATETFQSGFDIEELDKAEDQGFIDTVQMLYDNGLKLEVIKGFTVATIDFERLLRNYGNEIGEDIKVYMELVQSTLKIQAKVSSQDDLNNVAHLIVEHDKYLKAYPNSMVIEDVLAKRNWLRKVYFVEGTFVSTYLGTDVVDPLASFKDIVQFYPGSELEKMTQGFISVWSRVGAKESPILNAYVDFYDEGVKNSEILLSEGESADGFTYPRLEGLEIGSFIQADLENTLDAFKTRYITDDMGDWKTIQSYEIVTFTQDEISIVIYFDLIHPEYPSLSVRDIMGRTYNLRTGNAMVLGDLLPTDQESITHLLADIMQFAGKNDFDASQVDETWPFTYQSQDGLVIFIPGIQTNHNAEQLTIPSELILEWID